MANYSSDDSASVSTAILVVIIAVIIIIEQNAARIIRFLEGVMQKIGDLVGTFMSFAGHLLLWIGGIAAVLFVIALIVWGVSTAARETWSRFKRVPDLEGQTERLRQSLEEVYKTDQGIDRRLDSHWRHIAALQEKLKSLEGGTVDKKKVDSVAADILGVSHDG